MKREKVYLGSLYVVATLAIIALGIAVYLSWWKRVPEQIRLHQGQQQEIEFGVPAFGRMEDGQSVIPLDEPVTFVAGENLAQCVVEFKLFGILPFKEVGIQVIPDEMVVPAGLPVGIYVQTQGVLVLATGEFMGMDGTMQKPSASILQEGDYILETDGRAVTGKKEFMETVEQSEGREMILQVKRGEDIFPVRVKPKKNQNGAYKIGVWIRENAQGVGTLTYIRGDGDFGALGHGVNDMDTSTLMEVERGSLYETEIIGIRKGKSGMPGELTGIIDYDADHKMGNITENTEKGIFGQADEKLLKQTTEQPIRIGLKQNIHPGRAEIICSVTGEPEHYGVEIEEVHLDKEEVNRGLVLRVTDERLLKLTGGIVQGMSGSPILQDGKLIGAVTHVFVNDPTKGYGIFLETMVTH